jgi:hypothetical protein
MQIIRNYNLLIKFGDDVFSAMVVYYFAKYMNLKSNIKIEQFNKNS